MTVSLPSKKIVIADAPEVENFSSAFIYNYFTADEKTNESGDIADKFLSKQEKSHFNEALIESKNFQNKVPRMIKFSWKPIIKTSQTKSIENYYNERVVANKISIKNNLSKIQNESTFSEKQFLNLEIQDNSIDKKISFFVRRALDELGINNGQIQQSPLDVAKELNKKTQDDIKGNFIAQALYELNSNGIKFIDNTNRQKVEDSIIEKIKKLKFNAQFNNKFLTQLLTTSKENIANPYTDEYTTIFNDFRQIQAQAIETEDSSLISQLDYDIKIENYLNIRKIDANFDTVIIPIGYIIEKYEIISNISKIKKESIIIENPFTTIGLDAKIKYGAKYSYKIRTICYVETNAIEEYTGDIVAVSFLLSSKNSEEKLIDCREYVPPPSPSDFNAIWDYVDKQLTLIWSFPPNQQRDIKYFQIFKRNSINEPFEMVKMYDFDDSEILSILPETPENFLIEEMDNPKSYYTDKEFTKESTAIYSICCIDAHGISSNYSIQYEISFDKFKNKIVKSLVSISGAPKAYPNMFLNKDTFVDTIKDSGHKQMSIYFNPEYLQVIDSANNDLQLIKTKTDSFYRLQMINVDLQKEQAVDIKIEDRRSEIQKQNLTINSSIS